MLVTGGRVHCATSLPAVIAPAYNPKPVLKWLLCAACMWLPAGAAVEARAQSELRLASDFDAPRSTAQLDGFDDLVVIEACRRVGLTMSRVHLPAGRTLALANQGVEDGVYSRISGFSARYPELVVVPEPVGEITYVAFSRNTELAISGWESLRPLSLAVVQGRATTDVHTAGMQDVVYVREPLQLFRMLKAGRVEVVVYEHWQGVVAARRVGLVDVVVHQPALQSLPLYLYLNSRHAALVPKLAEALRSMKQDGTYARLHAQTTALVDEICTTKN